jgi:CRISPR system Cascade subunit CasA
MNSFNLIDEDWIPVRFLDGRRLELGVRRTLQRASEIAEIEHPSPLVAVALHRTLLAILYRAQEGPTDIDQAKQLFAAGIAHERVFEIPGYMASPI